MKCYLSIICCLCCIFPLQGYINPYQTEEPLSLEMLIDIALRNNPDTAIAWANVRAVKAAHCQNLSDNYVAIEYDGLGERSHISRQKAPSATSLSYNQELAISYLLFDFGQRTYSHYSTWYALKSAIYDKNWVIETVVLEVIESYTNYLDAISQLHARFADLEDAKLNFDIADTLYRAGIRTRSDMLQARSDLLEAEIQKDTAEGIVEIRFGELKNALGITQMADIQVQNLPEEFSPYEINDKLDHLLDTAKEYRNDLKAAYASVQQREALYSRAVVDGLPSLNVGWSAGQRTGQKPRENYRTGAEFAVSIPIFQGYFFKNGRRRARAELDREVAVLDNSCQQSALEVVTSYYAFKTAYRTYEGTVEFLKNAEESYEVTLANYKAGVSAFQALSDAQRSLTTARSQHIQAKTAWILSLSRLTYFTGMILNTNKPVYKECS